MGAFDEKWAGRGGQKGGWCEKSEFGAAGTRKENKEKGGGGREGKIGRG